MNDAEMRISIAEACGWKRVTLRDGWGDVWEDWKNDAQPFKSGLPDYPSDLNAICEAIKSLPPDRPHSSNPNDYPTWMFNSHLCKVLGIQLFENGHFVGNQDSLFKFVNATARDRAIAFLKTIGKYHD